jgi:hypothetical protein
MFCETVKIECPMKKQECDTCLLKHSWTKLGLDIEENHIKNYSNIDEIFKDYPSLMSKDKYPVLIEKWQTIDITG